MLRSSHSISFSGGAAKSVYIRAVSQPYLSAMSMAPTTLPLDLDMAVPPFSTVPWQNSRRNGSSCVTMPMSRITLQKNREYIRCRMA